MAVDANRPMRRLASRCLRRTEKCEHGAEHKHSRRVKGIEVEEEEGRETLGALFAHATVADNVYTHHWRNGDFVMWDNRVTMHKALSNYTDGDVRHLLRTSVKGEVPV